jgi:hypothetical protein
LNTGSSWQGAASSSPDWMAATMAFVCSSSMRRPTPYLRMPGRDACRRFTAERLQQVHALLRSMRARGWSRLRGCGPPAARPPCVDQPGLGAVLLQLGAQHGGILERVPDQGGGGVAGGEGGLRLRDALLRARRLGRVAAHKVVEGLGGAQPADRRQHAKQVAAEEHRVARVAAQARHRGVGCARGSGGAGEHRPAVKQQPSCKPPAIPRSGHHAPRMPLPPASGHHSPNHQRQP